MRTTLVRAGAPLTLTALKRALPASFKPDKSALEAAVERLVSAGALFRNKTNVSAEDPLEVTQRALRDELARHSGAVPPATMKASLKKQASWVVPHFAMALETLVQAGTVHPHHWKPNGTFSAKPIGYSLERDSGPDPAVVIAKARAPVTKIIGPAVSAGASPSRLGDALRRLVVSDKDLVLEHLRATVQSSSSDEMFSIGTLRFNVPLDKPSFDRAVLALRAERRVNLYIHDDPQSLGRLERACLVLDDTAGGGAYYVGITLSKRDS